MVENPVQVQFREKRGFMTMETVFSAESCWKTEPNFLPEGKKKRLAEVARFFPL